jgi:uncharacterized protein (DUF2235 family)
MSKNIVFCADGTWNGPGSTDADHKDVVTNVFKLFLNLAGKDTPDSILLAKEQERVLAADDGTVSQAAKYIHGVGDSDNYLVKLLGGSVGAGIITRIVRGYTFISRNYEPGDRIYIVGFSRGAYTARALGGMIAAQGLLASNLHLDDRKRAYLLGTAAWYGYRRAALAANSDWLAKLEEIAIELPGLLTKLPASAFVAAPIEVIAVWDTVGALGIPDYLRHMQQIDSFKFADTKLSAKVAHGLHAVAIDELRLDFIPTLWDPDPRIAQALFPGAHADVGGGYPATNGESGLSDRTLTWMTTRLDDLGVLFSTSPAVVPKPDAGGCAHQPWTKVPWTALPRKERHFPSGLSLAQSVIDRLAVASVLAEPGFVPGPYSPPNLTNYLTNRQPAPGVEILFG